MVGDEEAPHEAQPGPSISRRGFIALASTVALSTGLLSFGRLVSSSPQLLRPPGVVDEAVLRSLCVRCNRCADVCPTAGIAPANLGLVDTGTPELVGYCAIYEELIAPDLTANVAFKEGGREGTPCLRCIDACPTGGLQPLPIEEVRLGVAHINEATCLAWITPGTCLRCRDICVFDAIHVEARRPVVAAADCTGCVQCSHVCPVAPAAIVVRPLGAPSPFR